ncbi:hypothetical protein V5799_014075 [Amblyomma americanum]|uniref:Nlr family card domain protein n=1 Tax=Amblyomma americanum TaxID=6943 RepID=A0AAQ4E4B2_AMBAM
MSGAVNRYAGLSVDHRRPCTSQEGRLCHIFGSLKAWNSFLWMIGVELQEKSASELSLVKASDGTLHTGSATVNEKLLLGMHLYHLVAEHHCVVEATISDEILADHQDTICHAIRHSRALKRITLAFTFARLLFSWAHLTEAIGSLTRLECLSLHGNIHGDLLASLAPILAGSASLTVFHASDMHVRDPPVNVFMEGLSKNRSITELTLTTKVLGRGIWRSGSGNRSLGLDTYLRANTHLTSLKITAPLAGPEIDVRTVCMALSENKVLTRLELELHRLKSEYATPIKCLLSSSKTLKYFSLAYRRIDRSGTASNERQYPVHVVSHRQYCPQCRADHSEVTDRVRPWIMALLTDGTALQQLAVSMWGFCFLECQSFLQAMARNKTLQQLTMKGLHRNTLRMCSALGESDAQKRVLVNGESTVIYPEDTPSRIGHFQPVPFSLLQAVANEVTTTSNLTKIKLQVFSILCVTGETDPASTDIVQLIVRAPCIKVLALSFQRECCNKCWNQCAPAICEAVCSNPAIRDLSVRFARRCRLDMAPLASLLHRSRTLRGFSLEPPCPYSFTEFVTELLKPEFEDNHTLHSLYFVYEGSEMMNERLAIQDIVHRNWVLPKRAAAYVTGTSAKYTADAFQKVSESSALIEELRRVASIEEARAKQLVAESALRLANFTEFMRLAGVVFDSVECNPSEDGKVQLDDLPELCLRRIRKFLRLSDVLDGQH